MLCSADGRAERVMRRAVARRAAVGLTALQLVLTVALSLNLVVCSAADGHVAVESALADDCCADEHSAAPVVSRGPECGGCTDVPLAKTLIQRNESTDRTASARPVIWTSLLPPPVCAASRPLPPDSPHTRAVTSAAPVLDALRVVVLVV
jgi:hypothetical protein